MFMCSVSLYEYGECEEKISGANIILKFSVWLGCYQPNFNVGHYRGIPLMCLSRFSMFGMNAIHELVMIVVI